jgi:hypothetical protein
MATAERQPRRHCHAQLNEKANKFWVLALALIASHTVTLDALLVTTALNSVTG